MKQLQPLQAYLQQSAYIDFQHASLQKLVTSFRQETELERIKAAFEYVRDEIRHSMDIRNEEVTRRASEVLEKGHGICYAKSHLLAALLRGMGIPSGITYQRLTLSDTPEDGYCIHALNTVYVRELGKWIRLDARGNKEGIDAQFSTEEEKLAFPIRPEYDERDYGINFHEPHPAIIETLQTYTNSIEMCQVGLPEHLQEEGER
ncbi:transglutaminase [Xylanibacillus composti]|uniref:Transglutaminase n=1 Tax=Xylanibacillus composti TaxID=1572762 RepID=A0A8J4H6A7_9BACL|nr:transglutaminase family protein [Xylanibacillus composti]GIQ69639.1 transglutaminase [Xylanibacillus composti]